MIAKFVYNSLFINMIFKYIYIYVILILVSFSSCRFVDYSFVGGTLDPKIETIAIKYFPNNADIVQPTLSQSFTEALRDKFTGQTRLNMVEKNGDLNIEGEIISYYTQPVAIQGNETAALNRLTITVNVRFINTINSEQDFESSFSRYEDYESSLNLSAVENTLIQQINETLVEDIFNRIVVNW